MKVNISRYCKQFSRSDYFTTVHNMWWLFAAQIVDVDGLDHSLTGFLSPKLISPLPVKATINPPKRQFSFEHCIFIDDAVIRWISDQLILRKVNK